jgi:hypothetical protein
MKMKCKKLNWISSGALGLALLGWTGGASAVDQIVVNTFDSASELSTWHDEAHVGVLEWANPGDWGGCLKITLPLASGGTQVQPQVTLGANHFNSAQYWSVSFDLKVDPASGTLSDGTYGHWQVVARNSSWSWVGLNWSVLDSSYTNGFRHVELGFVQPYDVIEYLVFQVQGSGYSGDLIYYLDNIKINPLPNSILINAFTNASEVAAYSAWGATGSGVSWVNSPNSGTIVPAGSMQILGNYDGTVSGWSEATCQRDFSFDPSRFTYFDLDVYLDPSSASPYGMVQVYLRQNHSPWNWIWLGNHGFTANDSGKWVHLSYPMASSGETNAAGFVIQTGGNGMMGPVKVYVDNVKIWTPVTPPTLAKPTRGGPGGTTVTMDQPGVANQWEREAISTPAATRSYTWYNMGGVSYSFTLAAFPDPVLHPGFEAHLYMVNEDTIPGTDPAWNETYGAPDWNAADILVAHVVNNAGGGVDFSIQYKTNQPNAGVNNTLLSVHGSTAIGTWQVAIASDNTSFTITGPGGVSTNASLPQEVADRFNCAVSFLQFGAFKNDGAGNGINDGASATFREVQMTGGSYPFDDTFAGPGLTANYAWRTTSASAVNWSPDGVGWWLSWSLPDDGFTVQVAPVVTGPYADAGVTYTYAKGATRVGAVPITSLPVGSAAFFRLMKPGQ